jgi:hypothetical protein
MAHELRLEIFKMCLKSKEKGKKIGFRDLFRTKFNYAEFNEGPTNEDIFKKYHTDFVNKMDLKGYVKNDEKQKAFAIHPAEGTVSSPINANEVLSAVLKGGHYGRKRDYADLENKAQRQDLKKESVVNDLFYFNLYTPLDNNEGILMVQGYTEFKISDIIKDFLKIYFCNDDIKCDFSFYTPESLKEKYLNGAKFSSMEFSTGWVINGDFEDDFPDNYELQVNIEIIDKNKKVSYSAISNLKKRLGESFMQMVGNDKVKKLSEFKTKKPKIIKNEREVPIDIDKDGEIRLAINLRDEGFIVDADGIPNYVEIENYCTDLLEQIKIKLLPRYAIEPI